MNEKRAIGAGTAVGTLTGMANAPEGHLLQNTAHGAFRGLGADLGMGVGAAGGFAGSTALAAGIEKNYPGFMQEHPVLGALLLGGGTGAGMGLGAGLGWMGAGKLLGKSPADKDREGQLKRRFAVEKVSGLIKAAKDRRLLTTSFRDAMLGVSPCCSDIGLISLPTMLKLAMEGRGEKRASRKVTREGLLKLARVTVNMNFRIAMGSQLDKLASSDPSPRMQRAWAVTRDAVLSGTHPAQAVKMAFARANDQQALAIARSVARQAANSLAKVAAIKTACGPRCTKTRTMKEYHGSPEGAKAWMFKEG